MSNTSRNVVRKSLSSKFSSLESKKIETSIYNHCSVVYNGFTGKYGDLFSIEEFYKTLSYEKVGQIITYPNKKDNILKNTSSFFSPVYDVLCSDKVGAGAIVSVLEWNGCSYADFRENEKKDTIGQADVMKVQKGEFKCKVKTCRSDECYHFTMQTRGCDEGGTTYVVCTKCRGMYTIA